MSALTGLLGGMYLETVELGVDIGEGLSVRKVIPHEVGDGLP